jgi:hypothetical protein
MRERLVRRDMRFEKQHFKVFTWKNWVKSHVLNILKVFFLLREVRVTSTHEKKGSQKFDGQHVGIFILKPGSYIQLPSIHL